ncbi:MAG: undecaprenyldiphospho-muramoylpentapeptide beta-N-acetylglucosaminyltransferase [Candidatus Omnitrophota bacterium]|nr:undecaprenyldiphospho-muramoylpentapeptide beta-N-acetylglucosaminyltransferase [Candidatus Omnitrophota bacterium]MDZ4242366.1 undecaprenyldiphospho-muramoylpentapeptide beta-N-acetylglucosaminyltransferase [Candidatus Omnitrophota bacterium]
MKIVMATGGSGGHLFPALYVADVLRVRGHEVFFAGAFGGMEEKIRRHGYSFRDLPAKGLKTNSLKSVLEFSAAMIQSMARAGTMLREIRPDAVVGFGGYGSFPVVASAIVQRRPAMIHEQNVIPGRANRVLFQFADRVTLSFERTKSYCRRKDAVVTGCPSHRPDPRWTGRSAREHFGLDPEKFTVLILGGSQGSRRINREFLSAVEGMGTPAGLQIIHLCGQADFGEMGREYRRIGADVRLFEFLDEMEAAYAAADMVISRAGAVTVSEIAAFGVPAVLIPYPYAGGHQRANALVLAESGRADMVEEKDLSAKLLETLILDRMTHRGNRLAAAVMPPDAAERLAGEVLSLAAGRGKRKGT